ncbi:cyclic lactone autoinducer peptide [Pseudobutyrivibrio sp. UC1225]|nr:cyclic lactone autoinducer peptide [Pseudobutyrivibrio sp. UC1225]
MEKKSKKNTHKLIKGIMDTALRIEANSSSCAVLYQPKEPKEIQRFKSK